MMKMNLRDSCWTVQVIREQLLQNLILLYFGGWVTWCNLLHLHKLWQSNNGQKDLKKTIIHGYISPVNYSKLDKIDFFFFL